MIASFLLTLRALVRGRVVVLLLGAAGLIHFLMPGVVRSDGTAAGAFEMHIRSVPGSVATMLLLTMLTVACGLFAREREDKRLALALVRPASALGIATGYDRRMNVNKSPLVEKRVNGVSGFATNSENGAEGVCPRS